MYQFKNKIQLIGTINIITVKVNENDFKQAVFILSTTDQFWTETGLKSSGNMNHLCKANSKLADIVERYISQGAEIAVEGSLIQPQETDPLGAIPYIQVSDLLILNKR